MQSNSWRIYQLLGSSIQSHGSHRFHDKNSHRGIGAFELLADMSEFHSFQDQNKADRSDRLSPWKVVTLWWQHIDVGYLERFPIQRFSTLRNTTINCSIYYNKAQPGSILQSNPRPPFRNSDPHRRRNSLHKDLHIRRFCTCPLFCNRSHIPGDMSYPGRRASVASPSSRHCSIYSLVFPLCRKRCNPLLKLKCDNRQALL